LLAFVSILSAAPVLAGAVYYVDSSNGSDANSGLSASVPWKTIAKVNRSVFTPGDSILFKRGGTWWETLIPPSSGMSGNNITFGAYGTGDLPKIDGSAKSYCVEGKKDYITITDLHLTSPTQFGIAHTKWNSSGTELSTPGWMIKNCRFTKCGVYLFGPNTVVQDNVLVGPGPITGSDSHGAIVIRGLVATNCSVLRNTVSGFASRGIWFLNGAGSPTVIDNLVYAITFRPGTVTEGYGIDFDGYGRPITGTVTAAGNTVYDCANNGIELENSTGASVISGNLVHDCPSGILYLNYTAGKNYPDLRGKDVHGVVAYNIIYHCQAGVSLNDVSGVDIWNNTICDGIGSYPRGLMINDAGTAGAPFVKAIDFRNNIVGSGMSRSASAKYALNSHFIAFDYSAVVDPVIEIRSQSTYLNLSQLKSGGAALHCFTTNPGFVDAAGHDFHLLSTSPCINAGAYVGLTQDLEGKSINGVPDIGAYESGPPTSTTPPMVTTTVPSIIQSTSATSGGIVTSDGGATVTERGVCWGLSINPTVSGSHTHDGSGTGIYSSSLSGLSPNTTYHTRAYATNSSGIGYGSDISFKTLTATSVTLKVPLLLTPYWASTGQPTTISLTWRDKNTDPSETGYMIRIKPNGGAYAYYTTGKDVQSYTIAGLLSQTKYYWNVKALGDGNSIEDSAWALATSDCIFTTK